jgi:hypothetical protein
VPGPRADNATATPAAIKITASAATPATRGPRLRETRVDRRLGGAGDGGAGPGVGANAVPLGLGCRTDPCPGQAAWPVGCDRPARWGALAMPGAAAVGMARTGCWMMLSCGTLVGGVAAVGGGAAPAASGAAAAGGGAAGWAAAVSCRGLVDGAGVTGGPLPTGAEAGRVGWEGRSSLTRPACAALAAVTAACIFRKSASGRTGTELDPGPLRAAPGTRLASGGAWLSRAMPSPPGSAFRFDSTCHSLNARRAYAGSLFKHND